VHGRHARAALALGVAVLCAWALPGCARKNATAGAAGHDGSVRLGLVTDVAGLGDGSFNDAAYSGLRAAGDKLGVQIAVERSATASDYHANLTLLANEEYDAIVGVGALMRDDVEGVARAFPRRRFALVDAVSREPNVASIVFREEDGSFLAGALAALMSRTHDVAFIGAVDTPRFRALEAGFTAGAHEIDSRVRVTTRYLGSFEDETTANRTAAALLERHADVLYVAAGQAGLGAFAATRGRPGTYAIAIDANRSALVAARVLTSVVKRVDVALFRLAEETRNQKYPSGVVRYGYSDGGIELANLPYTRATVGAARMARLERVARALASGRIVAPATREALAAFTPVAL